MRVFVMYVVIVAELVDPNNITDINFPGDNSLFIPASYIEQRFKQQSDGTGKLIFLIPTV